jgi:putative phage-type endonuclease
VTIWPIPVEEIRDRRQIVGASDAPTIMGKNPWMSRHALWMYKCGWEPPKKTSPAMLRGIFLEEEARQAFSEWRGIKFSPKIMYHPEYEWMVASLDGLSENEDEILEIKCPGAKDHATAETLVVPEKYHYQLYHQLAVTGMPFVWYYSWNGATGVPIEFYRDDYKISAMITAELKFWYGVQEKLPPHLVGDIMQDGLVSQFDVVYPHWVCQECAKKYGGHGRHGAIATWHPDICDVCNCWKIVTEPRDFGYPDLPYRKNLTKIRKELMDAAQEYRKEDPEGNRLGIQELQERVDAIDASLLNRDFS